jgi:hypothetical protein
MMGLFAPAVFSEKTDLDIHLTECRFDSSDVHNVAESKMFCFQSNMIWLIVSSIKDKVRTLELL